MPADCCGSAAEYSYSAKTSNSAAVTVGAAAELAAQSVAAAFGCATHRRMRSLANSRGNTVLYIVLGLFAVFVFGGLVLHFGQKRHNQLAYDADVAYPPDRALVGGEAYASTAAAIMNMVTV